MWERADAAAGRRLPSLTTSAFVIVNVVKFIKGVWTFSVSLVLRTPSNTLLFANIEKSYISMTDNSGTMTSFSSMKGRLHDGLLQGLAAMGYE